MKKPNSRRNLDIAIERIIGDRDLAIQTRRHMANIILAQMLPECVIKGGSSIKIRLGEASSRYSLDLDTARSIELEKFIDLLEENLHQGWDDFTGHVVGKRPAKPKNVPSAYVMQPFEIKLQYMGRPWLTIPLEIGHNEIGDANEADFVEATDLYDIFSQLQLQKPGPVRLMKLEYQIAQKLHGVTEEDSMRAHDLIDLQLIVNASKVDYIKTKEICKRLFNYRGMQQWPPVVKKNKDWDNLYQDQSKRLDVLDSVDDAIVWCNDLIKTIDNSK